MQTWSHLTEQARKTEGESYLLIVINLALLAIVKGGCWKFHCLLVFLYQPIHAWICYVEGIGMFFAPHEWFLRKTLKFAESLKKFLTITAILIIKKMLTLVIKVHVVMHGSQMCEHWQDFNQGSGPLNVCSLDFLHHRRHRTRALVKVYEWVGEWA